jgi:integration host factor subunit beta
LFSVFVVLSVGAQNRGKQFWGEAQQGYLEARGGDHGFFAELGNITMTKSELIERIAEQQDQLSLKDVELAVKLMLDHMSQVLATGERIEIRGFGSFSLHYRAPRVGRNPKTGDSVELAGKYVPHFKPGKEMRDRVNESIGLSH